jgi:electron transport complex protein RnfC
LKSIIERIKKGHFWQFHGGIHPPEQKFLTNDKPIRTVELPQELIIPLQQHIGQSGELLIKPGDKVLKGQQLTQFSSPMAVPVHAPTSGLVTAVKPSTIAHPSGLNDLCIFITPDGEDKWQERKSCENFYQLSQHELISKIANAGIAGMGGAGFPTHIKTNTQSSVNYLIINAAECEPYITADDLLIREQSTTIIDGIKILDLLLKPEYILIGIEDNKPEAIKVLKQGTKDIEKIIVCVLPTKYPTGGEKQLIKALTGLEVPSDKLPLSLGIVMQNVATCYAIADAVINDTPLLKRVVTITGQALEKPQNIWALLGTPINYLLAQCGYLINNDKHLIMGGPMMGFSLANDNVPIVKTTNCILAPSEEEISTKTKEVDCIRCGQCADVCPSQLLPQELQWSAKAKDHNQLMKLNLFDCIDCGACAYVCPSQIPLVQYYRVAKAEIRQQQILDLQAEKAKGRFEARKLRLDKEKLAREAKHKKAAEARKAAMNNKTASGKSATSAVAAALARVKAKKLGAKAPQEENIVNVSDITQRTSDLSDKQSQVAIVIAKAKANKEAVKAVNSVANEKNETTTKIVKEKTTKDKALDITLVVEQKKEMTKVATEHSTTPTLAIADDNKEIKRKEAVAKIMAKKKIKKQQEIETK